MTAATSTAPVRVTEPEHVPNTSQPKVAEIWSSRSGGAAGRCGRFHDHSELEFMGGWPNRAGHRRCLRSRRHYAAQHENCRHRSGRAMSPISSRCIRATSSSSWKTTITKPKWHRRVQRWKLQEPRSRTTCASANFKIHASNGLLPESIRRKAEIAAAQAGEEAAQADVVRTQAERTRQESLLQTHSTTQQKVEQAVADQQRLRRSSPAAKPIWRRRKRCCAAANWQPRRSGVQRLCWNRRRPAHRGPSRQRGGTSVAQVNLGIHEDLGARRWHAWANGKSAPGQLVSPGTQVIPFVDAQMGAGKLPRDSAHECEGRGCGGDPH